MSELITTLDIETTGLSPFKNQITCICAKTIKGKMFEMHAEYDKRSKIKNKISEQRLIYEFLSWLSFLKKPLVVGHAVETFDLPFIMVRAEKLNTSHPIILQVNTFDTKLESRHLKDKFLSLNDLATELGIKAQKTGTGTEAIQLFYNKEYKKLVEYCMNDVTLTEEVYKKLKEVKQIGKK
jgi:DNA polymerase III epsilon subunit-like protein